MISVDAASYGGSEIMYESMSNGEVRAITGVGELTPQYSTTKFRLPITPLRNVISCLQDSIRNGKLFEDENDEYARSVMTPFLQTVGSLQYGVGVEIPIMKEFRKIHRGILERLPKPILVIGDNNARCLNWNIEQLSVMTNGSIAHSRHPGRVLPAVVYPDVSQYKTVYVLYESEIGEIDLPSLRKRLRGTIIVEPFSDYYGLSSDSTLMVSATSIKKNGGDHEFMVDIGGTQYVSHNYDKIDGSVRYDMRHFLQLLKAPDSSSSRYYHVWTSMHLETGGSQIEFNSGLPLTNSDLTIITNDEVVILDKTDGRRGALKIDRGEYVISCDDIEIKRGRTRIIGRHLVQIEVLNKLYYIVDVYDSTDGSGGYLLRYNNFKQYVGELERIGCFFKKLYRPDQVMEAWNRASEGIVIQRIHSPPGAVVRFGAMECHGTARYIKKKWTIDIMIDNPLLCVRSVDYKGPGIYEVTKETYKADRYDVIRKRGDKKFPNSTFQIQCILNAWTIEKYAASRGVYVENSIGVARRLCGLVLDTEKEHFTDTTPVALEEIGLVEELRKEELYGAPEYDAVGEDIVYWDDDGDDPLDYTGSRSEVAQMHRKNDRRRKKVVQANQVPAPIYNKLTGKEIRYVPKSTILDVFKDSPVVVREKVIEKGGAFWNSKGRIGGERIPLAESVRQKPLSTVKKKVVPPDPESSRMFGEGFE